MLLTYENEYVGQLVYVALRAKMNVWDTRYMLLTYENEYVG